MGTRDTKSWAKKNPTKHLNTTHKNLDYYGEQQRKNEKFSYQPGCYNCKKRKQISLFNWYSHLGDAFYILVEAGLS